MQKEKYDSILQQVNQMDTVYDKEATLHRLFEEQAGREPGRTAATYRSERITYGQLNEKANQLAQKLRAYGIKPNDIVGLMVSRSLDMLIGMLAVLKAGGCYLPIDPKFPGARIDHMLKDSGTKILLTQQEIPYMQSESEWFGGRILYLDENVYQGPSGNLDNVNKSSDLAYVIYTSGSTGVPKGVMIQHSGIYNFIVGMLEKIAFRKDKKIVSLTTISFDIFVLESLLPLTQGMEILIADPMSFAQDMMGSDVQMLQTTPSTVQLILNDESNCRYFKGLTDIMLGGEAFPPGLLKKLKTITDANIYNMYGPTETTVWSMVKDLTNTDFITVGQPIANTQIYLADEALNIVNLLEEGEICIAGDGLSRGYLNREDLTKQRFVDNKMFPGSKMYRTGDLGRWLANGEVEFLGRIDSQVKIRGFRIELGEIEAALQKIPKITECVVAAKTNEEGGSYLVAYYRSEECFIVSDLIAYLKRTLPEYEVPGIYMKIDSIPLTPNGKINRLALPDPKLKRPNLNTEYMKPETELETEIFEIWSALLGYGTIGIKDNYFDLGGNSILVSQLQTELEKKFQMKIEVAELFSNNTIEQQCTLLSKGKRGVRLQGVILPDTFYSITGKDSRPITENNIEISREVQETIKKYASDLELDVKAVYLALFMFLLAQQTGQDEIELMRMVSLEEYIPYCMDVSLFSDLQELCRKVSEDLSANRKRTSVIKADDIQNYHFTDERAVIITCDETGFCKNSLFENEINFSIYEQAEFVELKLRSNPHKLNEEEVLKLITGYLQCIKAVAEAVKEGL